MKKNWQILHGLKSKTKNERQEELIKALLGNRGLNTKKKQAEFFSPKNPMKISLKETGISPLEIKKAARRINKAVKNKELIVVYGDYDADGITSTAILWETLHKLKARAFPFIPHREEHGYGLKKEGVDSLTKIYGKPGLIITVDNGIVAFSGAKYCKKLGIDLIVTDHHQEKLKIKKEKLKIVKSKIQLPEAVAIVHTTNLSGAGVAWFFSREIVKSCQLLLELAAIGTITDMVPLAGANRSIVKFGLEFLKKTNRPGLKAVISEAKINLADISTYNVGYMIGPRLNAMGRLEHALDSLRLVCTKDEQRAIKLAVDLANTNKQRQDLTFSALDHALTNRKSQITNHKLVFIAHESYSPGVIGLVAGKLVEKYWRPAIVIAEGKSYSKGSVRSVPGVNIIDFLRRLEGEFEDLGGHPMAAGFTIKTSEIVKIQEKLEKLADKLIDEEFLSKSLEIDCEIKLADIDRKLYSILEKFEPFGVGNRRPVFAVTGAQIIYHRTVGKDGKHVKMQIHQPPSAIIEAIYFNGAEQIKNLDISYAIDLAFQIDENEWNGRKSLQLVVKDVKSDINLR